MRSNSATAIDAATREQKERRLRQFIESFIDRIEACCPAEDGERTCLLLAHSPDSPVARVIAELIEGKRLRLSVRAIFTTLETGASSGGVNLSTLPAFAAAVRLARDPRLLDAHEQLVLGTRTSWVGDCMRRDPLKRDAFEAFAADGQGKARRATASFERIWRVSVPAPIALPHEHSAEAPLQASCVSVIADEPTGGKPGTRAQTSR
jgi:hypothetical protein